MTHSLSRKRLTNRCMLIAANLEQEYLILLNPLNHLSLKVASSSREGTECRECRESQKVEKGQKGQNVEKVIFPLSPSLPISPLYTLYTLSPLFPIFTLYTNNKTLWKNNRNLIIAIFIGKRTAS